MKLRLRRPAEKCYCALEAGERVRRDDITVP